ncbi:lantibiotic dehydratase C-terminal domain-containing protein [Streptomyces sp. H27-D2]|uniref:lantibiotic dehydratase C-terminal domain-containing protein n=1 Tax=Streptomyces sp. H27-D2 TaxID=3046304 RepID=UPI002DBCA60E|nr:lantibiotic dehydratase C-terminal domain-containing protein [Streptomyces sp. H27-D2]MEC4020254.1 lantibiotic dehydratase C-terminal domain-containing protein [Streptomyces sp. H27-D2]
MSNALLEADWWYARLYPGGIDHLDLAVSTCLPPLVELATTHGANRWFFIQYTDWKGPHLRLRVHGPRNTLDLLHRQLPRLEIELKQLSRRQVSSRGSLIPLELRPFSGRHSGADVTIYEPEDTKYGGPAGTELAEGVFQRSSELALWAGRLPRHPDRAALAVLLLNASAAAIEALGQDIDIPQFWERHLAWWTHDTGKEAEGLRAQLRSSAGEDLWGIAVKVALLASDPAVHAYTQGWTMSLLEYLVRASEDGTPYSAGHLVFHQAHMMCNRLGILPREEALLGIMAAQLHGMSVTNL